MKFTIMMRLEVRSIPFISSYYFTLSYVTNQSTSSLDYITINLGKLNDTKPTILEVRHPHIDHIIQEFVLLRVVLLLVQSTPHQPYFESFGDLYYYDVLVYSDYSCGCGF